MADILVDIAVSLACKVGKCLLAPVGRHCGYVIFTDRHVRKLNDEIEKLESKSDEVKSSIDEDRNDMKPIKPKVDEWIKKADAGITNARGIRENNGMANTTCFYGWLPNPKARYRLGKEASGKVKDIKELIRQGQFERVSDKNPPPGLVGGAPDVNSLAGDGDGGDFITDSRAPVFQDIIKALNDEKLKVVGVHGPGGVGKTTLLNIVEKKLKNGGGPFKYIARATVSQSPKFENIQYDIAYDLNLGSVKNEPSEKGRRDLLFKRLEEDPNEKDPDEKVLIILDDLWEELDLEKVGIPSGDTGGKCKLLLTSRNKEVLKLHEARIFHLGGLKEDEALRLFEKTVGNRLQDDEGLKEKAAQVVRKLEGLPLLIESVAKILKCREVFEWNSMLIKIEDPKAERIVKWSYDYLMGEDVKCLFLLCGLIGGTIEVELLLGLGMGLGWFESFTETITKSRERLSTMLNRLHSFCLLQGGGDGKKNVTIHDLYSEVVVSGAFSDQISLMFDKKDGSWPNKKLERCWACLVHVGRNRLAKLMVGPSPHVNILMLAEKSDRGDCNRMDFTYMEELRALYLCSMHITSFPSSMEILRNLQSLSINCYVEDVTNLGKLKALQILSFARSEISRLPKEIGELTNLRSLNLSYCYLLEIIELGALKGLINLEELHMRESFDRWMGKDEIPSEPSESCNARLVELNSLTKIASLEISIRDPTILLEDDDFPFGNLIRFRINIGNAIRRRPIGDLRTMELKLEEWDSILSKDWVQKLLQKTQYLHLDGLKEFKKNTHELCTQGFGELKHLDIANSPSINYIANSSDGLPLTAFTMLESLHLDNLNNLEKICNSLVAPECFSILKVVTIARCPQLKNLWFLSEMQRLVHLERLIVSYCNSMQAIITNGAGNIGVAVDDAVELPNLRILDLDGLPKMTSFCTGAEDAPIQVSLPRLESLRTYGLFGLEEILYNDPSMKYSNLKRLEIKNYKFRSKCILKSDWILKLSNLEFMEINNFPSAEVFYDMEELKLTGDAEILPRLTKLRLNDLQNLQCMWKQDVQLQGLSIFQNLGELNVYNTGLPFLFPVYVAKCLRAIRDIEVKECPFMKAVIVDEEGSDEGTYDVIEFPLLERLYIYKCPMKKFFSYSHGNKKSVTTNSDSQDANSDSFFDQKASLPRLKHFHIEEPTEWILQKIWPSELPGSSFCELATLHIGNCSKLLNVFPSTIIRRLQNLKIVYTDCPSLESLFECGSLDENTWQKTVSLPKLERVTVHRARKLRCMVESHSRMILCFPSLKEVGVHHCSDMRYLFPNFTATRLTQLEKIWIRHCEKMKEVVLKKGGGQSEADVMNFLSLVDLRIQNCPNLEAFIRSPTQLGEMVEENNESPQSLFNEMVMFPNIKSLFIVGLQCKELWNNQIPADSFSKLESLGLECCDNLQCVAPSHMWKRLQCCLKNLKVMKCRSIKIIYEGDGTDTEGGKLRCLVLRNLENLKCIWQSDSLPNILFPNLSVVEVVRCSRLDMLFTTFTVKFLGQIEGLVVESCEDMKLIAGNKKGEEGSGTGITFSKLTLLRLFELPKFRNFLPEKYSLKFRRPEDFPCLQDWSIESCGEEPHQVHGDWRAHHSERKWRRLGGKMLGPWWCDHPVHDFWASMSQLSR